MNEDQSAVATAEEFQAGRIDLATAQFLEEDAVSIDTETDQFSFAPPPPDGSYLVKLRMDNEKGIEGKITSKEAKTPNKKYAQITVIAEIIDGEFEGRLIYDRQNTLVSDRGTNSIAGMLLALGQELPPKMSAKDLLQMAQDALAMEPSAKVTGRWEAYSKEANNGKGKKIRGMKNFPPRVGADGQPIKGEYKNQFIDKDGNEFQANFAVTRYDPAD